MLGEMQAPFEEECMLKSMRDVLRQMQVCSSRTIRQQGEMRQVLREHDHPWWQAQVSLTTASSSSSSAHAPSQYVIN